MVMKLSIRGIAFVVLMMSVVLVGMAAPPTVLITAPTDNQTINLTFQFVAHITNTAENLNLVEFDITNGTSWTGVQNITNPNRNTSSSGEDFTFTLDTRTLADGNYTLSVTATNENLNSLTALRNFSIDNTPPPAVTLTNITVGQTWINWTWTAPSVADFNKVLIYIDNAYVTFISHAPGSSQSYNTNFASNTSHNISLRSVDTTGNINSTGATNTSSTLSNTPTGQVTLTDSNIIINFSNVISSGTTTITNSTDFSPNGGSLFTSVGKFYTVTTTAGIGGNNVTIGLTYTTLTPSGYQDSDLRLYRYDGASWANITTTRDSTKVYGNVTGFSTFVLGVQPRPAIIKDSPTGLNYETIGVQQAIFKAHSDQTTNITWYVDNFLVLNNGSIASGSIATYTNISPLTGSHNVTVTATNITTGLSNSTYWNWTVRSRTYETGNRIWDANKEMNLTYTWNPMSFYAFYYDVDNNVGNESLKIQLATKTDRNLPENTITYTTKPDNVSFKYKTWGSYNVIGFMAEKYFASYTSGSTGITSTPVSTIGSKQLHRILIDDDTKRAVYAGSTYTLNEGYVLKVKDVDITGGKIVLLSLLKDGNVVDTTATPSGSTYVYTKRVGAVSDVPIIAVHIDTVFSGREANAAFLKGIFQISEGFTSINTGNKYGIMEITGASDAGITMVNKASLSLSPASLNDLMGDIKIVVADNSSVLRFAPTIKKSGTYEVRGTISQATDPATIDWNPLNFEGFYYDINEDVGSEKLTLTRSGRTIDEKALVYTTSPQAVSYKYKNFGTYKVIGFMANKYFAGYIGSPTGLSTTSISTIASKQLHKVLADDNTQRAVYAGSTLTLSEGYVLKVKDVDITGGKIVLVSLLKDGNEVDTTAIQAGNTYTYSKRVGTVSDLPIIAAHIETVFAGREANAAFIKGIFQISESITTVTTNDQYGIMKVTEISDNRIQMNSTSTVTLSQNSIIDVMGNIKFHVADSSDIRFYPFILVNGDLASANQLSISVPSNPSVKDTITIAVTAGSSPADGAAITFDDNSIGTTNSTGKLDYTLTRSGMHNITATKLGYEKAVKTIQVAEWVDNRLSIDIPAIIDQGIPVSIKVQSNGTAIAGASITLDNSVIGTTDIKGILNYSFTVSGTHNLGASKDKYISVVREISIRMPFSEYKALDINISPNVVFVNVQTFIKSNITNAGTKADTKQVELIVNSTVVDNRSVSLAPGEIKEVNFTYKEAQPGNYTVEIIGQKGLLEVKKEPTNYLLIGGIATVLGIIAIYILTAKGILGNLLSKFGKKGIEEVKSIEEVKK